MFILNVIQILFYYIYINIKLFLKIYNVIYLKYVGIGFY